MLLRSANMPLSMSYRSPRFKVRRPLSVQSSWIQPAPTSFGVYCLNPTAEMPIVNVLNSDDIGARFHVETSRIFGKYCSMLAGGLLVPASYVPMQFVH